jgi:hypothetical protein
MKRTHLILLLTAGLMLLCLLDQAKATDPTQSEAAIQEDTTAEDTGEPSEADLDLLDQLHNEDSDEDEDSDAEFDDLDPNNDDDDDDDDSIESDWKKVLETTLKDKDAYHNKDTILHLAYLHLIYEDVTLLGELKLKHQAKEAKLDDEESASLSNAMVAKAYVDEKFGDREEISNDEAIMILNTDRYDAWMDEMPDNVINL